MLHGATTLLHTQLYVRVRNLLLCWWNFLLSFRSSSLFLPSFPPSFNFCGLIFMFCIHQFFLTLRLNPKTFVIHSEVVESIETPCYPVRIEEVSHEWVSNFIHSTWKMALEGLAKNQYSNRVLQGEWFEERWAEGNLGPVCSSKY